MTYQGMGYPSVKEGCRAGYDIPGIGYQRSMLILGMISKVGYDIPGYMG